MDNTIWAYVTVKIAGKSSRDSIKIDETATLLYIIQ